MEESLLAVLVCPLCKSKLHYRKKENSLICKIDKLSFPIEDDIPIMLEARATQLSLDEIESLE